MEYRSVADLDRLTLGWVPSLPRDLELVVGISSGGMLVAGLLAVRLRVPVTDLRGFCERRLHGRRCEDGPDLGGKHRVLVVDDAIGSGRSLAAARARIEAAGQAHEIHYGALIASPEAVRDRQIDLFAEIVPTPRIFEWSVEQTPSSSRACVQLEGVLVPDGGGADRPLVCSGCEVGWIVTSRPETRRRETEEWLRDQGLGYGELLMGCTDLAAVYRDLGAELLVVHSAARASAIADGAGTAVFSTEQGAMIYPGDHLGHLRVLVRLGNRVVRDARRWANLPVRWVNRLARTFVGRPVVATRHQSTRDLKDIVLPYRLQ